MRFLRVAVVGVMAMAAIAVSSPVEAASPSTAIQTCAGVHGRLVCNGHSVPRTWHWECVYVSRFDLEVTGWVAILEGGVFSVAGLLSDGTIVGLPLGALLGILGIGEGVGGSYLVWYADTYFHPGWYCGWVRY